MYAVPPSSAPPSASAAPSPDLPPAPRTLAIVAAALSLDAPQTHVLWAIAAPALSLPVFRLYRARWPHGPWPSLERACRMASAGDGARAAALEETIRARSPLTRLGVLTLKPPIAGRTAVRVAPDVLRALAGRTPTLPNALRGAATVSPLGVGWGSPAQRHLRAALSALRAGELRWLHVPAAPTDGVYDAVAVDRPVLAVDAALLASTMDAGLRVAARVARLRQLWLLVRASARVWPAVHRWAHAAPGPFIVESPPGCRPTPASGWRGVAVERLDAAARYHIWRAEVGPDAAHHLAARHRLGRAAILAIVDAVRLRGDALSVTAIEAEVTRRAQRLDR